MRDAKTPDQAPPYELVCRESAYDAVTQYVLEGGDTVPMCQPGTAKEVQRAVDAITNGVGWDDDRKARLGEVVGEMKAQHDAASEAAFRQARTPRVSPGEAHHRSGGNMAKHAF